MQRVKDSSCMLKGMNMFFKEKFNSKEVNDLIKKQQEKRDLIYKLNKKFISMDFFDIVKCALNSEEDFSILDEFINNNSFYEKDCAISHNVRIFLSIKGNIDETIVNIFNLINEGNFEITKNNHNSYTIFEKSKDFKMTVLFCNKALKYKSETHISLNENEIKVLYYACSKRYENKQKVVEEKYKEKRKREIEKERQNLKSLFG